MRIRRLFKKEIERNFPNEDVDWLINKENCIPIGSSILDLASKHVGTYCG